ncbi:1-acyl-sn-glycerol-3-phosphate acyltransferase [Sinobacterium caligoides]|uniref:1-acyl-sn-glycerol-3-phosphate acyltransferase n=1 Tax=Sinobacterium caligoides TaxID=933926 RepID=A0A3N2DGZ9_9GAMM|nr:lysophospholipid acyltransferase family protein [Sinobacterium caligoides]ROR99021.1 1-acyl-sn-glycerol-3-phosphate acyltransferase [Sinobacterium caligoides]
MNRPVTLGLKLRAILFYIGYGISAFWFGTTGMIFFGLLPFSIRSKYLLLWNRFICWWLKVTCGIRYEIKGLDNIAADGPRVVLAKHQSSLETIYLQLLFQPLSTTLKRELLRIPGFGWGLSLLKPIAIDRGNPRQAIRQVMEKGKARLAEGISVLIFPEGTRILPGKSGKHAKSGAALAVAAEVAVIPVAHNAGEFWPSEGLAKFPGTVTLSIGEKIDSAGKTAEQLKEEVKNWIESECELISTLN